MTYTPLSNTAGLGPAIFVRLDTPEFITYPVQINQDVRQFANAVKKRFAGPYKERPNTGCIYIQLIQYGITEIDRIVFCSQSGEENTPQYRINFPVDLYNEISNIVEEIKNGSRAKSGRLAVKKIDVILQLLSVGLEVAQNMDNGSEI